MQQKSQCKMRIALFQPDIPQNVGAVMRIAACFNFSVDIIEPCGFPFDDKRIRRSGMDYIEQVQLIRHSSWDVFRESIGNAKLILFTTKSDRMLGAEKIEFCDRDILLFGRESAGVTEEVHKAANIRLKIPISGNTRSLNLATSVAIAAWEFYR